MFKTKEIIITNAVYEELKSSPVFDDLLSYLADKKIIVKNAFKKDIPENLGNGEGESISLAKDKNAKLLMDDRKAGTFAESIDVKVIDIPTFLFYCKENKLLSVSEIKEIIIQLKEKDYYEFNDEIRKELT